MQVLIYLSAIVAANLTINHFGPSATVYVALILIGLDMAMRDSLHSKWQGKNLWAKMLLLILIGSIISAAFGSGRIAFASFMAFLSAGVVDAVVYQLLGKRSRAIKVNGSNVVSALVDSGLFLTIAFGFMPVMILMQWGVKVVGGYTWSVVIRKKSAKESIGVWRLGKWSRS